MVCITKKKIVLKHSGMWREDKLKRHVNGNVHGTQKSVEHGVWLVQLGG